MSFLDYFVLTFYLLGMIAVGLVFARKNKSSADMFSAGGQSPWWASGLSAYMTMFSAGTFVVWGGIAYQQGAVAIAINCCYGVAAFVIGYFVAARWKKLGVGSPAEFLELRFGEPVVVFYTWAMMVFRVVGTAVALYALAVILVALMPLPDGHFLQDPATGDLSVTWAILIFGGIVVAYTMIGGLWAVLMTDVLQFIVLTLAVCLLLPLILTDVGGWSSFVDQAPDGFFNIVTKDYSYYFLAGWVLIHIFMIGAEWAFVQRFISVKTESDAKKSAYLFGGLYILSPALWMLPPMIYKVIQPDAAPEQAYMLASAHVLPAGMVGLMVAAMFSATASLVSSQLNVFAGVLTEHLHLKYFQKNANEKQQVWIGRSYTVGLGFLLIGIAMMVPYMGGAEKVIVAITSLLVGPLMAPTLFGLLGTKVNSKSIWITVAVCFVASVIAKYGLKDGGWLTDVTALSGLAELVQNSGRMLDITLGVALPVIVLLILHFTAKEDAEGAIRIANYQAKSEAQPEVADDGDNLPLKVVMYAMLCFTILFIIVAALADKQQTHLLLFAGLTAIISFSLNVVYRKQQDKFQSTRVEHDIASAE